MKGNIAPTRSVRPVLEHQYGPALLFLFITILAVILAEVIAMIVINRWGRLTFPLEVFLDTLIMSILIIPVLYFFSYKRLVDQIEKRQQINENLLAEIEERIKVESQLKLQATALESAANGIIITDRQGNIQWANPAFLEMTGYHRDEVMQHNTRILKSGQHDREFFQQLWETILSGNVWRGKITNRRKDGSMYVEEQTITPVYGERDQITAFIAIKQDVTERETAKQLLEQRNRELQLLTKAEHDQRLFTEGLVQATIALNSSLDLDVVLDRILEETTKVISCRAACILLTDGKIITTMRHIGCEQVSEILKSKGITITIESDQLLKEMSTTLEPVLVEDTVSDIKWKWYEGLEWVRSSVAAPLVLDQFALGFIRLLSDQIHYFSQENKEQLMAFAIHAALAIQNARHYNEQLRAHKTSETLRQASLALTKTLELDAVGHTLLEYLQQLVPYDQAYLILLEDKEYFSIRAIRDVENTEKITTNKQQTFKVESYPHIRDLLQDGTSLLVEDTRKFKRWRSLPGSIKVANWLGIPVFAGSKPIGMCGIEHTIPGSFTQEHVRLAEALVGQASVAVQNAWLFEQLRAGRERLQSLSHRQVEILEQERRYIAGELHDETGQALTSLLVGLRLLEKKLHDPDSLIAAIEDMDRTLQNVSENLHRLAMDLRPASLDHLGLGAALRQQIESFAETQSVEVKFDALDITDRLPPNMETLLYRIVQEALTNIARHAQATRVEILLQKRDNSLVMIIEDNGIGFKTTDALKTERLGLFGMRERAEMLGGELIIESILGKGTTISVEVPHVYTNLDRR